MITEEQIIRDLNRFRALIKRGPINPSDTDVVYAHFKAGYLLALGFDLAARGVCADNWQGDKLEFAIAGEDLL